jgi:hypothetical protein
METLEYTEEPVRVVHVKPDAIVFDEADIFLSFLSAPNLDLGTRTATGEFDSVGNEIDKYKLQHRRFTVDTWQLAKPPFNVPPLRNLRNLLDRLL